MAVRLINCSCDCGCNQPSLFCSHMQLDFITTGMQWIRVENMQHRDSCGLLRKTCRESYHVTAALGAMQDVVISILKSKIMQLTHEPIRWVHVYARLYSRVCGKALSHLSDWSMCFTTFTQFQGPSVRQSSPHTVCWARHEPYSSLSVIHAV
jgi:hypothetical protein